MRIRESANLFILVPALMAPLQVLAAPVEQSQDSTLSKVLPIIVVAIIVGMLVLRQYLLRADRTLPPSEPGRLRDYGVSGAAICRNCGRPFSRSPLDLNMVTGKLVRCPYCKKWAVLPAASPAALAEAEERERRMMNITGERRVEPAVLSEEEQLSRRIENSKYE